MKGSNSDYPDAPAWVRASLQAGIVIPAHPLALDDQGSFDERRQRALTRYYHASGAGGIAVGVHTTQFAIRDQSVGLFEPVLSLAADTVRDCDEATGRQTVRIAGISGPTPQAISEAKLARELGFHAGLLSLSALANASVEKLIEHARNVAREIALIGFYLQPAVGGRVLSEAFWTSFSQIPNVIAIKIAPFNRYQTLDVLRGVVASGRREEIALYTGNDDNILIDLLTEYRIKHGRESHTVRFAGGLLGHWACWTRRAVEHLEQSKLWRESKQVPAEALTLAADITDANAAFFDAANGFAGCIAGIHEVLRRQGLLASIRCIDKNETLSPGQAEQIDRVYRAYPHLNDDDFVEQHIDHWMRL